MSINLSGPAGTTRRITTVAAVIANGASLSAAAELGAFTLVGIIMPAAWTAAALTFQASVDDDTYNNVYDDEGNEVEVTAAASRYIHLDPAMTVGWRHVKVRSGTSGAAVNQGAERTLTLVVRPV